MNRLHMFNSITTALLACPNDNLFLSKHAHTVDSLGVALCIGDISEKLVDTFLNSSWTSSEKKETAFAVLIGLLQSPHNNLRRSFLAVTKEMDQEKIESWMENGFPQDVAISVYTHLVKVATVTTDGIYKGSKQWPV